jgi:hypothetical protein
MACLYRHIRKDIEMPFYIGIGLDTKRAYSKTHRNAHWKSIVGKTDYEVEILFDDIDYEYAKIKEKEFIALYRRKEDGGILCNLTLGGDGVLGIVHTEEARKKMGAPNKGKTISEWQKQRTSEFHKGKKVSEETRKKMSKSVLGEKNHMYGTKASEETKQKMINSAKRGEQNMSSKLTELNVLEIRKLHNEGYSSRKIAKMFNVVKNTALSIINKKTWKHI